MDASFLDDWPVWSIVAILFGLEYALGGWPAVLGTILGVLLGWFAISLIQRWR